MLAKSRGPGLRGPSRNLAVRHERLAAAHRMSDGALCVTAHSLREQYREILRIGIAHTLTIFPVGVQGHGFRRVLQTPVCSYEARRLA